jgi:hypothetical protein
MDRPATPPSSSTSMAAATIAAVVRVAFRPAGDRRRTGRFGAGSGGAAQAEAAADPAASTDGGVDGP